jgi:hypothetical protein
LNGFTAQISVHDHDSADPRGLCPRHTIILGSRRIDVRLRLIALVLLVIAIAY